MTNNCLTCKYEPDWDLPRDKRYKNKYGECKWMETHVVPVTLQLAEGSLFLRSGSREVCLLDIEGDFEEVISNCPAHEPKEDQEER